MLAGSFGYPLALMSTDTTTDPLPEGWPDESAQRLSKAQALRELGVAIYPTRFERTHRLPEVQAAYGEKTL